MNIPLKSTSASKIVWAQIVSVLAMILAVFGLDFPPEMQAHLVAAIVALQALVTFILRTWFTTSITTASAKRAGLLSPSDGRSRR